MFFKNVNFRLVIFVVVVCGFYNFAINAFVDSLKQKHVIGTWKTAGFFAGFNNVLNHLGWCEDNNKIPVVYWDQACLYYSAQGFNGSSNVWEYYFEPVSDLNYHSGELINRTYPGGQYAFNYFAISPKERQLAFYFINKYIKIKFVVQKKIDDFYNQHMRNKQIIGIHLRGTDKGSEEKLVSPEKIVAAALQYADANSYFFVASDDQHLLDTMIRLLRRPKDRILFYDCYRSNNGKPLHQPQRKSKPSFAQLGEDVLVEVSLLARCSMLVHTYSNVSAGILYFNPNMQSVLVR